MNQILHKKTVELVIPANRLAKRHEDLAHHIMRLVPDVSVTLRPAGFEPWPTGFKFLLGLEKLLHGAQCKTFEPVENRLKPTEDPDIIIYIGIKTRNLNALHLLFNGDISEDAAFADLLRSGLPRLDLVEGGTILTSARPMIDHRQGLTTGFDDFNARMATLIAGYLLQKMPRIIKPEPIQNRPLTNVFLLKSALRQITHKIKYSLIKAMFYTPHWQVSFRLNQESKAIPDGNLEGTPWIPVPNPPGRFLADPFPFTFRGKDYIFVEDFDHATQIGRISVVGIDEKGRPSKPTIIIDEPRHFSFPFVFFHGNDVYLMPETGSDKRLDLYKAVIFPTHWQKETSLFDNQELADCTPFLHNGTRYMFAAQRDGAGSAADMAVLYIADSLKGEWREHPQSPIRIEATSARPAGGIIVKDDRLYRPVQDNSKGYGSAMKLFEITRLTPTEFEEKELTHFTPPANRRSWRMHTYNHNGKYEVIDGSAIAIRLFEKIKQKLSKLFSW